MEVLVVILNGVQVADRRLAVLVLGVDDDDSVKQLNSLVGGFRLAANVLLGLVVSILPAGQILAVAKTGKTGFDLEVVASACPANDDDQPEDENHFPNRNFHGETSLVKHGERQHIIK